MIYNETQNFGDTLGMHKIFVVIRMMHKKNITKHTLMPERESNPIRSDEYQNLKFNIVMQCTQPNIVSFRLRNSPGL